MPKEIFPAARKIKKIAPEIHTDGLNHWPTPGNQRHCAAQNCTAKTTYYCTKCNVGLHPQKTYKDWINDRLFFAILDILDIFAIE